MGLSAKHPPRQGLCPLHHPRAHEQPPHWFQTRIPLRSVSTNMPSAGLHPEIISQYLEKELSRQCMLGPFPLHLALPEPQVNKTGLSRRATLQTSVDSSRTCPHPLAPVVSNGIETEVTSLSYITVDNVAQMAGDLGMQRCPPSES